MKRVGLQAPTAQGTCENARPSKVLGSNGTSCRGVDERRRKLDPGRDDDEPFEPIFHYLGQLGGGALQPGFDLGFADQVEGRDVLPADALERRPAVDPRGLGVPERANGGEARVAKLTLDVTL